MNFENIYEAVEDSGVVFLSYTGCLTQTLISGMTEALEYETENNDLTLSISTNIFTIFIELSQNIMNYSKSENQQSKVKDSKGLILVRRDADGNYYIQSQNIVSSDDKAKIEPKLFEILSMTRDEIKSKYKELRRSGRGTHAKGGGIGFYEVAKRSNSIEFKFKKIDSDKCYFNFIAKVNAK